MIDKILVKLTGVILMIISIALVVLLIRYDSDYDIMLIASLVFIITMIVTTFILGVAFIIAKVSKKTTTEIIEKSLKALEIIKEKNVDIKLLKLSTNLLDYYTMVHAKTGENTELTEEEFDLLKEVLE